MLNGITSPVVPTRSVELSGAAAAPPQPVTRTQDMEHSKRARTRRVTREASVARTSGLENDGGLVGTGAALAAYSTAVHTKPRKLYAFGWETDATWTLVMRRSMAP